METIYKGYKYEIYPSPDQAERLEMYFDGSRWLYNALVEVYNENRKMYHRNETYKGKIPSKFDLYKELTLLRAEHPVYADIPVEVSRSALERFSKAMEGIYKKRAKAPTFKSKYRGQQSFSVDSFNFSLEKKWISIPKVKNKIPLGNNRPFEGIPKRLTITKTPTGRYYVSVLVDTGEVIPEQKPIEEKTSRGVDFGLKDLAVTSDGRVYEAQKRIKKLQARLRVEQRSLQRKEKGSKNREKQKKVVATLHEKLKNQRSNYLHLVSNSLLRGADTVFIEDLSVSNMMKNHKLAQAISDAGWGSLREKLEYKSGWQGKNVFTIDRWEASSKTCSSCGTKKDSLTLSERVFTCDSCGHTEDRDLNAAKNIKRMGLATHLK